MRIVLASTLKRKARRAQEIQIYETAKPFFRYPNLDESHWFLPRVTKWDEADYPSPPPINAPKVARIQHKWQVKHVGLKIIPMEWSLHLPPTISLTLMWRRAFETQMQLRFGPLKFHYAPEQNSIYISRVLPEPKVTEMSLAEYDNRHAIE